MPIGKRYWYCHMTFYLPTYLPTYRSKVLLLLPPPDTKLWNLFQIATSALKSSVVGEVLKTKAPLGVQMIMTKLDASSTVGADTVNISINH